VPCGLYGKIPVKRDFVALGTTRAFLGVWEPWMQGGLSASMATLGKGWQDVFLRAPIWRFWLGAAVCGTTIAGAFMPSVDAVGRYFPLTVFAFSEPPGSFPPPELDPQDVWFAGIEDYLLTALQPGASFEVLTQALNELPAPLSYLEALPPAGMVRLADGTVGIEAPLAALPARLASLRVEDHARVYAGTTVWWTTGGEGCVPLALISRNMPSPQLFSTLLTGCLEDHRL
jgi:type VI secretion system protein ImpM